MFNFTRYFPVNLQLFAEGSAAADGGTAGNAAKGVTATDAMSQVGVSDTDAGVVQTSPQSDSGNGTDDLDARFEELIKGEFKEAYNKRVHNTMNKRLKNSKETTEKFEKLQPALQMIAKGYKVDGNDIDAIVAAVQNDDKYYEEEALKAGVDVEFYKRLKRAENTVEANARDRQMREDIARWNNDFETNVKPVYQNMTFDMAMSNPKFVKMMSMGIDALSAVTAINAREVIPSVMEAAARSAEKKVTDHIAANGSRPIEGAAKSTAGITTKSDVSSLTNTDIDRILERVRGGEKGIDFVNKY